MSNKVSSCMFECALTVIKKRVYGINQRISSFNFTLSNRVWKKASNDLSNLWWAKLTQRTWIYSNCAAAKIPRTLSYVSRWFLQSCRTRHVCNTHIDWWFKIVFARHNLWGRTTNMQWPSPQQGSWFLLCDKTCHKPQYLYLPEM